AVSALVAAVTQILIVGLLRIVPARRVREALTLLGAVMSVLAYALWYGSSAGRGQAAGVAGRFQTVTDRTQPLARWTPPGWAGNAAAATQAGDAVAALGWSLLLFVATGALIGCAYALFRRAFLVGWSGTREVAPRRSATRHTASLLDRISTPWSPPVRAIAIKEIRTLVRDTKRLSIIVRSVGFVFVYLFLFIFRRTASGVGTSLPTEANSWLRLLILITFLLMGLSNGVSGYVFGTEGTAFGLYRLAPIAATTVLVAKWLAGVCLVAPFSMIVALGAAVWLRGGPGEIALAPVIALSYTLGLAAIRVAAAAISPRFDAPQPNRSTGQVGSLAGLVASGLFALGSFVCWAGIVLPTIPATTSGLRAVKGQPAIVVAVALAGGIIALGSTATIWTIARRQLARLLAPQAA
ncbi:MAG: hypothetical protein M3176_12550, partial [Chloroflexota bacterium]|nr:hypothetical protein [Chloroflexota bacterium]